MFRTMLDLQIVSAQDTSVTLTIDGLKNPVQLAIRKYERGAVVTVPWVWKDKLGYSTYEALKAHLRPHYGHVETRTEADPRFAQAASARAGRSSARKQEAVHA